MTAMRPLWSKEECALCGMEGYATRTMPRPASDIYICGECETHKEGYEEGYEAGFAEARNIFTEKLELMLKELAK